MLSPDKISVFQLCSIFRAHIAGGVCLFIQLIVYVCEKEEGRGVISAPVASCHGEWEQKGGGGLA